MNLSRRGWNNVIIYSVLMAILLFYIVPQHIATQRQKTFPSAKLVPSGFELLQLRFAVSSLQQAGSQWRFQPALAVAIDPAALALHWQQTELKPWPVAIELSAQPQRQVQLLLAGESKPQLWSLYRNGPLYYLKREGYRDIFQLSAEQAEALIPQALSETPAQKTS